MVSHFGTFTKWLPCVVNILCARAGVLNISIESLHGIVEAGDVSRDSDNIRFSFVGGRTCVLYVRVKLSIRLGKKAIEWCRLYHFT